MFDTGLKEWAVITDLLIPIMYRSVGDEMMGQAMENGEIEQVLVDIAQAWESLLFHHDSKQMFLSEWYNLRSLVAKANLKDLSKDIDTIVHENNNWDVFMNKLDELEKKYPEEVE